MDNNNVEMLRIISNLEYAAYNLTRRRKETNLPQGILESTCPQDSLLIALRDIKRLHGNTTQFRR